MSVLWVNGIGMVLITFIILWFWVIKPRSQSIDTETLTITVADGVYTPAYIEARAGRPFVLRFLRKDPSACAEKVIFPQLGIEAELPLDREYDLPLSPPPGVYAFTCDMQMYRGSLVVK
jgi:plastocyanin domain-containing protein